MNAAVVRRAEQVIDRWHIDGRPAAELLTDRLSAATGRPLTLPVRTLLVGRLLLADACFSGSDAPQLCNRLHRLLLDMHPRTRQRLGISWEDDDGVEHTVTCRQVTYLWRRLVESLDPSPHFGGAGLPADELADRSRLLQATVDGLMDATLPVDDVHAGSYALDATYLPSWATPHWKSSTRREAEREAAKQDREAEDAQDADEDTQEAEDGDSIEFDPSAVIGDVELAEKANAVALSRLPSDKLTGEQRALLTKDPDARHRWQQRRGKRPSKDVFGYQITIAVRCPEDDGEAVPPLVERFTVRPATDDEVDAGRHLVEKVAARGPLSDVIVDRGYSFKRPERLSLPAREAGGSLVIDLHPLQRGPRGHSTGGALWLDGWPHSPATPEELWELPAPKPADTSEEIKAKLDAFERRFAYALRRVASETGSERFRCPALADGVICPLRPSSQRLDPAKRLTIWEPPETLPPKVCTQQTVRIPYVPEEQAWIRQRHYFGSLAWYESYKRRNVVEGVFGHLKSPASGHLRRGTIRAFGAHRTPCWSVC